MVVSKKRTAFNTTTPRFGPSTIHPKLDYNGLYVKRPDACDPCLYNPNLIQHYCEGIHARSNQKDPWRYKVELEQWSQNLGYRNQKILIQRKWDRSVLGPAWHEIAEPKKYEPVCPNTGFGRTPRWKAARTIAPPPGTYYKAVPYKAPYGPHSKRQTFDREHPCRFKDETPSWSLAPNRYTIRDKESIEEKSNKIVSLKGPYDLFSGSRSGPVYNKFGQRRVSAATWPLALPGCLERYKMTRLGVMNKTGRDIPFKGREALVDLAMSVRKPDEPCPATYDIVKPTVFKQNARGFNSSYDKPPGYRRVVVWPGVGRYTFRDTHSIMGHGHRTVFKSKVGKTIGAYIPEKMNTF